METFSFFFSSRTAKDMYIRVPGLYCILLTGHTIHTQVSREEEGRNTVWKYIYDLLKIIGSIVVPFPVYLRLFLSLLLYFFLAELFCEMLGHRKKKI